MTVRLLAWVGAASEGSTVATGVGVGVDVDAGVIVSVNVCDCADVSVGERGRGRECSCVHGCGDEFDCGYGRVGLNH